MNASEIRDYERIAQGISFITQHQLNQPDLKTVADQVGLSEYHFQKMFTRWAGISPKRFLQYLTIERAKVKIKDSKSLLDLSLDLGLSSPARLHDLFINLEAMSPGEYKADGANLQIYYAVHHTPFGKALIGTTERGICTLHFLDLNEEQTPEKILQESWPKAKLIHTPEITQFNPEVLSNQQPLALLVKGTNFQIQVWRALLKIPFGEITSYQTVAEMIGHPTATRAVANAVGKNPVAYLIPCHRVIRASGELSGYRWGLERKMSILNWEAKL